MIDREIAALLNAAEDYAEKKRALGDCPVGYDGHLPYLVDEAEKAFRDAFRAAVGAVIAEGPP